MTATAVFRRTAAVLVGLASVFVPAAPAFAISDGEEPGRGFGLVNTLLVYGGIPLGIFALVALLVVAGGFRNRPRYRPGRAWDFDPVWFAGPADPDTALVSARPGRHLTGGGASAEW